MATYDFSGLAAFETVVNQMVADHIAGTVKFAGGSQKGTSGRFTATFGTAAAADPNHTTEILMGRLRQLELLVSTLPR